MESEMEAPYKCTICNKSFKFKSTLRMHTRIYGGETRYSCEDCGKLFFFFNDLRRHMVVHSKKSKNGHKNETDFLQNKYYSREKTNYKCDICDDSFPSSRQRDHHMFIHTGTEHSKCELCGKIFDEAGSLQVHMNNVHPKGYRCGVCGKDFSKSSVLKLHMRLHTGEKPYSCSICGWLFSQEGNLRNHMLTHSGEKPHTCKTCGQTFSRSNNLKRHMLRLHSEESIKQEVLDSTEESYSSDINEKSHKCPTCGKSFSSKSNLKRHMLIHSEEKPPICHIPGTAYRCDRCCKSFTQLDHLTKHLCVPTKEKSEVPHKERIAYTDKEDGGYKCDNCEETFSRLASLKSHITLHLAKESNTDADDNLSSEALGIQSFQDTSFHHHKHKNAAKTSYKSDDCEETFTNLSSLKTHVVRHLGDKTDKDRVLTSETSDDSIKSSYKDNTCSDLCKHTSAGDNRYKYDKSCNQSKTKHLCNERMEKSCNPTSSVAPVAKVQKHICSTCSSECSDETSLWIHLQEHTWENAPPV